MAFTLATQYSLQLREQRLGYISISLDGWADGAAIPVITKGSSFEIGDSIYYCGADLTVDGDGTLAAGAVSTLFYVYADPTDSDFVCSTSAPTWDDEKQGYYATIGGHVSRCLCSIYKDGSSNYTQRTIWYSREYGILASGLTIALLANKDRTIRLATDATIKWNETSDQIEADKNLSVTGNILGTGDITRTGNVTATIVKATTSGYIYTTNPSQNDVFVAISPAIPNTNDRVQLSGGIDGDYYFMAIRTSSSRITLYRYYGTKTVDSGTGTSAGSNVALAW